MRALAYYIIVRNVTGNFRGNCKQNAVNEKPNVTGNFRGSRNKNAVNEKPNVTETIGTWL